MSARSWFAGLTPTISCCRPEYCTEISDGVSQADATKQTECKVFLNPRGVVHKASDCTHKVYHVGIGALCTATKVLILVKKKSCDDASRGTNLASKLGDEDVKTESVVVVGNVVDEILGRSTIIVESESIKL